MPTARLLTLKSELRSQNNTQAEVRCLRRGHQRLARLLRHPSLNQAWILGLQSDLESIISNSEGVQTLITVTSEPENGFNWTVLRTMMNCARNPDIAFLSVLNLLISKLEMQAEILNHWRYTDITERYYMTYGDTGHQI